MSEQEPVLRELVVMGGVLTPERIQELHEHVLVDAFGQSTWGQEKVVAYAIVGTAAGDPDLSEVCGGDPDCVHYLLVLLGRVPPCTIPAGAVNAQALVTVRPGGLRTFGANFAQLESSLDGVQVAGAYLYGAGPYNALVEVVGDELVPVSEALLALTDLDVVVSVDHHVFRREDTRDWGTFRG